MPVCLLGALLAVAAAATALAQAPQRIVGYYTAWSIYGRNFHVPQIPADQVTHVNYAFANVQNGRIALGDPYADIDRFYPGDCWNPGCLRGSFHQLQLLRQQHPHLKTLISVGGWTWSGGFSDAVLTAASRQAFATSIVDFVVLYDFDGADIDWEYPVGGGLTTNTTRPQDRQNYTLFLAELRQQLTARSLTTGRSYLLSIAAPCNPAILANLEVAQLHPLLDWLNLMSYDFHGPWGDPFTGHNAPLYPDPLDPTSEPMRSSFNASAGVAAYLALGVPPAKLHVGVPFYGRGFAGVAGGDHGMYGTYTSPSWPGTWENGVYDYSDLAANYVGSNGYVRYWNDTVRAPWLHKAANGFCISYDDARSMRDKAFLAQAAGLGGAMFWEFSGDRTNTLVAVLDEVLRQRPALRAPVRELSLAAPARLDLAVAGTPARAGAGYVLLASTSGTWPGLPVFGQTLPLNLDWLSSVALQAGNSGPFVRLLGSLDGNGDATAAIDLSGLGPLPPALLGLRLSLAGWLFTSPRSPAGEPTNPVDVFFRP